MKNRNAAGILTLVALFSAFWTQSQTGSNRRDGESVQYCLTHKKMNALKQDPAFMEQFLRDQQEMKNVEMQMKQQSNPQRVIYKIPVVFHVLHNNGPENISNAQILDGLTVLNRDYRLQNADANNVFIDFRASNPNATCTPADIEIEFVLATKAPDGTCFSGITRTLSPQSYSGDGGEQLQTIIENNDVYNGEWRGDQYLNIFVCGDIGDAAGYTYNPSDWMGASMYNGIFLLHGYLGRIGTSDEGTSRVLTHEVGHWLNLNHTWGGNNDAATSCGDDEVDDTPDTRGSLSCNLNENSCGPRANVENYMDYSYCEKMFSHGQKDRMRAALNSSVGSRNNIWTASNLALVGADGDTYLCAADFYSDRVKICAGSSVEFYDNSFNNVSSWNWSFPGAVTTTSIEQNPIVQYDTPGVYDAVLTVSDGISTMTKTIEDFITVTDTGTQIPILDGFEDYVNLAASNYWEVYNPQDNAGFEVVSTAAHTGAKSVKLASYGEDGPNVDELLADPVDLSNVTSQDGVTISFRFSYRKRVSTNTEKLFVLFTGNCGETWEIRKSIQGNALSGLAEPSPWTPTLAEHWTTVHLTNVTSQYWNPNFRFKFRFEGNNGNNLYLDDINLYPFGPSDSLVEEWAFSVPELETATEINLYPNPADGELNISYVVSGNKTANIQVTDLLGKTISEYRINSKSGENLVVLSTENLASGLYNAQITVEGKRYMKQFQVK